MKRNKIDLGANRNQAIRNGESYMGIMKTLNNLAWGISIGACGICHLESAHFYTGVPPVSVRPPRACPLHQHADGQGESDEASLLPPAPSKGSTALAPRCGYPEVRINVAVCDIHPSHHCARRLRAVHHTGG